MSAAMAAFRPWLLCICVSFVFLRGSSANDDAYALAKQWENYANGVNERLLEEQEKSSSLQANLEKYLTRAKDLEEELKVKEKGLEEKIEEINLLKGQLEAAAKQDVKALEDSLESEKSKVQELLEVNTKQTKDLKKAKTEAATKKTLEAEVFKLQSRNTILQAELLAAEKGAVRYNECHVTLLETEKALQSARNDILKKEEENAQLSLELGRLSDHTLPPWLIKQSTVLQSRTHYYWITYGEPALSHVYKTISKASTDFGTWAAPHVTTAHGVINKAASRASVVFKPVIEFTSNRVSPYVEKHWTSAKTAVSPHMETAHNYLNNKYSWIKDSASPYYLYLGEVCGPYYKVASDYVTPPVQKIWKLVDPYYSVVQSKTLYYHNDLKSRTKAFVQYMGFSLSEWILSLVAILLLSLPLLLVHWFTPLFLGFSKKRKSSKQDKGSNAHKKVKKPRRD